MPMTHLRGYNTSELKVMILPPKNLEDFFLNIANLHLIQYWLHTNKQRESNADTIVEILILQNGRQKQLVEK